MNFGGLRTYTGELWVNLLSPFWTVWDVWSRRAVKKFVFGHGRHGLPVSFSGFTIKTILRMREF